MTRGLAFPIAAGYDEEVKIGRSGRARAKVHVAYRAGFAARAGWVAEKDEPFRCGSVRPDILTDIPSQGSTSTSAIFILASCKLMRAA